MKEITTIDDVSTVSSTTEVFVKDSTKFGTVPFDNLAEASDYLTEQFATKVDKVAGKGLSTNDYSDDEKTKLSGIATAATRVVVSLDSDGNAVITYDEDNNVSTVLNASILG